MHQKVKCVDCGVQCDVGICPHCYAALVKSNKRRRKQITSLEKELEECKAQKMLMAQELSHWTWRQFRDHAETTTTQLSYFTWLREKYPELAEDIIEHLESLGGDDETTD